MADAERIREVATEELVNRGKFVACGDLYHLLTVAVIGDWGIKMLSDALQQLKGVTPYTVYNYDDVEQHKRDLTIAIQHGINMQSWRQEVEARVRTDLDDECDFDIDNELYLGIAMHLLNL